MHTLSKGGHALEYRQVKIFLKASHNAGDFRLFIVIRIVAVTVGQILLSCYGKRIEHRGKTFAFSPRYGPFWAICPFTIIKYKHTVYLLLHAFSQCLKKEVHTL